MPCPYCFVAVVVIIYGRCLFCKNLCWATASGGGSWGLECRGIVDNEVARGFQLIVVERDRCKQCAGIAW